MIPDVSIVRINEPINSTTFQYLLRFSPADKQQRILRQRIKQNADTMVAGSALVRYVLRKVFHIPRDAHIAYGEFGKPYLPDYPNVYFNLSHSGQYVVCAVSDRPVGIDIQVIRPYYLDVVRRVYNPRELEQIKNSADPASEFTKLWTKKEAYLKMLGCGLITDIKATAYSTASQMKTLKYENTYLSYISAGIKDVGNLQ